MGTVSDDNQNRQPNRENGAQKNGKKRTPKKAKRRYGDGTVYQRKDGRWVAEISMKFEGGKRSHISRYAKDEDEGYTILYQLQQEKRQKTLITGPDQPFKQLLEYWLEKIHRPSISKSTYVRYRSLLKNDILPSLGQIPLRKLMAEQVEALYAELFEEELSPSSIRMIHTILYQALTYAVKRKYIPQNVCKDIKLPTLTKQEMQTLSKDQALKLLEVVKGHRLEALFLLALITGMRRGELVGLRWKDINLDEGSIQVRRTVDRVPGEGLKESKPKTASGRRKIMLPQVAVDALKEHRAHQEEIRAKAGSVWREQDIVFCNALGGFLDPRNLLRTFSSLLKKADLPHIRFHDLRHSAATLLLTMGVHPKVVQEILGHSNIAITLGTYSHVLPSLQKGEMGKWDDLFGG
ncbi:MAG TPA: tyrosine-type recombinase/integrase [Ktedonosporobacter sp.]|nr:tyrosine-type recombinase/integrase [Ktedonosporobacter sp.]